MVYTKWGSGVGIARQATQRAHPLAASEVGNRQSKPRSLPGWSSGKPAQRQGALARLVVGGSGREAWVGAISA